MTLLASALVTGLVGAAGYFDADPVKVYTPAPPVGDIAVLNVSGDMGLRFLIGATTSRGLVAHHVPVVGIVAPAIFRQRRTRAEIDAFIADAVRLAMARTGRRVLVMGQSYGADIVQTGLARLPASLRAHVAGIVLVLPGDSVYFRADPSGLAYHGTPDNVATTTADTLDWAPLTCIYGVEETDSLCPLLRVPGARLVGMPGGHNIHHDADGLLRHVLAALARTRPA